VRSKGGLVSGPDLSMILELAREAVAWDLSGVPDSSAKMHMGQVQLLSSALLEAQSELARLREENEREITP
jgi:hypothetical protein